MVKKELPILAAGMLTFLFLWSLRPNAVLLGSSTVDNLSKMPYQIVFPLLDLTVLGVPGETLEETLERELDDPKLCQRSAIGIASGINNARNGGTAEKMLGKIKAFATKVGEKCGSKTPRIAMFELWQPRTTDTNTDEAKVCIRDFNEKLPRTGVSVLTAKVSGYEPDGLHPDENSRWNILWNFFVFTLKGTVLR